MATKEKELRVNKQIRSREVNVIDADGQHRGTMGFFDALRLAEESGLDLVEISPNARPPVCKVIDYDKFRYERRKRLKEAKKNQTVIKMREIRMQPKIDTNDLDIKTKAIGKFLDGGDKCKVTIRFRGRELAHTELGKDVLDKILSLLDEKEIDFNVDSRPRMEGRNMSMLLSPGKRIKK